jgi:hypothetical protein
MPDRLTGEPQGGQRLDAADELRQVLMRLTSPQIEDLQGELSKLKERIEAFGKLEVDTSQLQRELESTRSILENVEAKLLLLGRELREPESIEQRLETTMVPALYGQARQRSEEVAEALGPVMGPAIRYQILNAREDIIDALYPIIGQIISKSISESMRELTRNIDARLRRQLNFRDRVNQSLARLRGVSEAELVLRGSLPYSIERVFLIHRETGILLEHISAKQEVSGEMNTISGMLTAIQDFVRDSFGRGEGELEEITHGDRSILLEGGQFAYVAIVLSGVEPQGYSDLIRDVIHEIGIKYEKDLRKFNGDMAALPDFKPVLGRLLSFQPSANDGSDSGKPLSSSQKKIVGFTLAGLLLVIAAMIFACVFMIRLWPVAFPSLTLTPSITPTAIYTLIPSSTATVIPTVTATLTPVPTNTQTAVPPTATPLPVGLLTGALNVRREPTVDSPAVGVILAGESVLIREKQGDWYLIAWPVEGEPTLAGWILGNTYLELPADSNP